MGLDWEPLPTPKRGFEREYLDLFKKLARASLQRREQLASWFSDVSVPPFETIGAPRVGRDAEADDWLRARIEKSNRLDELEEIRAEMRDHCVLELLPPCDGFPVYSNHIVADHLDRYSFHAELLRDVADTLGDDLCERATQMMLPEDHRTFAAALDEVARRFATDHALPEHVATIREPVFPEGTLERKGHVLFAAAKWSTYWSGRGYGLAVLV